MKKLLALVLAVFMVFMTFTFTACGDNEDYEFKKVTAGNSDDDKNPDEGKEEYKPHIENKNTDMAMIKKNGKITVGVTEYPPMNYKDDKGEWTGFDTELTKAFAEKLGVEVEFFIINWDEKFDKLNDGTIDCVWNGMTITDEALNNADISDVYLKSSQVVVLSADKADSVKSIDDLRDLSFAVEKNSIGNSIAEVEDLKFTEVDAMSKALLEVQSGACDACIVDRTIAEATVGEGKSYANLAISITLSTEKFVVAFRPGSDLTAEFNAFLKEYQESGKFDKLAEKYNINIEQ